MFLLKYTGKCYRTKIQMSVDSSVVNHGSMGLVGKSKKRSWSIIYIYMYLYIFTHCMSGMTCMNIAINFQNVHTFVIACCSIHIHICIQEKRQQRSKEHRIHQHSPLVCLLFPKVYVCMHRQDKRQQCSTQHRIPSTQSQSLPVYPRAHWTLTKVRKSVTRHILHHWKNRSILFADAKVADRGGRHTSLKCTICLSLSFCTCTLCMYLYLCVYVRIFAGIHQYIHTYINLWTHTYMYWYIYIYICIYKYICIYIYAYVYVCI